MHRSVQEVTFMAAKMKETGYNYRSNAEPESPAEIIIQESTKKTKQKTVAAKGPDTKWTQDQQKQLENAIVTYTKSTAGDRWQKIANAVPGKTKEECLARYKHLVEIVKAQRAGQQTAEEADDNGGVGESDEVVPAKEDERDRTDTALKRVQTVEEPDDDEVPVKHKGGKPRNKRKLKKQQMDFSSDEEEVDE